MGPASSQIDNYNSFSNRWEYFGPDLQSPSDRTISILLEQATAIIYYFIILAFFEKVYYRIWTQVPPNLGCWS
jgi:hypothetical protein